MNYRDIVEELRQVMEIFFATKGHLFEEAIERTIESLKDSHKIVIFGNGGSAAQAQHFAAELVNKFLIERAPLRAISLTTDTSALTSIANDTSFDHVFSRQMEAIGDKGDVAIGISTSGNSANVIESIKIAKDKELITIAFTGMGGGKLSSLPDYLVDVPSESTPRIQEVHLLLLHLLAEEIEKKLG